jgi:hypothetical protein
VLGAVLTTVLAASAVGAYAAASSGSGTESSPIQQLATEGAGAGRSARADGLDASQATPAFTLRNGQSVSVVGDASAKCLIRNAGAHASETCDTLAAIDEGQAISVSDECGSVGRDLMEITGLAPDGVSAVRLIISNGTYESAAVVDGAFKFEGTNPAPGAPYPTGVAWLVGDGADAGTAPLPVDGDQFCLPTS